jgi:hypothetical protein
MMELVRFGEFWRHHDVRRQHIEDEIAKEKEATGAIG